jgi:hypothetical protein
MGNPMSAHMGVEAAPEPAGAAEPGAGVGPREGGEPEGYGEWIVPKSRFLESELGKAFSEFYRAVMRKPYERVRVCIYPITSRICIALLDSEGWTVGRSCADIIDFDWVLARVREMVQA